MHVDQFRKSMRIANLTAGLTVFAGVAASIHFGAVIVGILFTLAFAFTLHGIVYTAHCRWRIPDAGSHLTAPRVDDGPNGTGMIICSRPTGDMDLDFYLDTYASMRHGYGSRQIFLALRPTLFAVLVICVVMAF